VNLIQGLAQKFGSRTFGAPAGATGLLFFNEAAKMGLDPGTLKMVCWFSLIWAGIESVRDIVRMICEAFGRNKASASPPPVTTTTS
jgi:hypothetical protein